MPLFSSNALVCMRVYVCMHANHINVVCHSRILFNGRPCIRAKINFNHSARWRTSICELRRIHLFSLQFRNIFIRLRSFFFFLLHLLLTLVRNTLYIIGSLLTISMSIWKTWKHNETTSKTCSLAKYQCANLIGRHFFPRREGEWKTLSQRWNNTHQIDGKIAYWRCMYVAATLCMYLCNAYTNKDINMYTYSRCHIPCIGGCVCV